MTAIGRAAATHEHRPNAAGTRCLGCGIRAEAVTPDELAEALVVELDYAGIVDHGPGCPSTAGGDCDEAARPLATIA